MTSKNEGDLANLGSVSADVSASPGVLLLSSSFDTVAYNWEAVRILAFPNNPRRLKRVHAFLGRRIRSRLSTHSSGQGRQFVREFKSGSRTYRCNVVALQPGEVGSGMRGTIVLLFERQPYAALSLKRKVWKEFDLTPRQCQTVELLVRGMTTKEIAQSMNISPNTVKTYLRHIMAKMRVATRVGIVGKVLAP
jgi:DNA-binding CsgD family transcriptional regulator